jgi:hypothetical protein
LLLAAPSAFGAKADRNVALPPADSVSTLTSARTEASSSVPTVGNRTSVSGTGGATSSPPVFSCGETGNMPTTKPSRVLTAPELVVVQWGTGLFSELTGGSASEYFSDIATGSYLASLKNDYGVGTGTYKGTYVITPGTYIQANHCNFYGQCQIAESDVNKELSYQITTGTNGTKLPSPESEGVDGSGFANNLIYVVELPPGYQLTDQNGNSACSFHYQMVDNAGKTAAVAYISDQSPGSSCENGYQYTGMGASADVFFTMSHEIIEAAVDPFPATRYNGEIGDECDCNTYASSVSGLGQAAWTSFSGAYGKSWIVQQPWMLSTHSCAPMVLPTPAAPTMMSSSTFAASRTANNLDVFWSSSNGTLTTAAWPVNNTWGSWTIGGSTVVAGGKIATTARSANNLDLFYVGSSGAISTSAWPVNGNWASFNLTGPNSSTNANLYAPPGAPVAAISTGSSSLNVFFVDNSGNLHGLGWSGNGWSVFAADPLTGNIAPGASVAAVARYPFARDIFLIGKDGGIWRISTDFFDSWSEQEIPGTAGKAESGTSIAVSARSWDNMTVFFVDTNGNLESVSWNEASGWGSAATATGSPGAGAQIVAVSRSPLNLDAFEVDGNGVQNTWWENWSGSVAGSFGLTQTVGDGTAPFTRGIGVAATSRFSTQLDIFEPSTNGNVYTEWWNDSPSWNTYSIARY